MVHAPLYAARQHYETKNSRNELRLFKHGILLNDLTFALEPPPGTPSQSLTAPTALYLWPFLKMASKKACQFALSSSGGRSRELPGTFFVVVAEPDDFVGASSAGCLGI